MIQELQHEQTVAQFFTEKEQYPEVTEIVCNYMIKQGFEYLDRTILEEVVIEYLGDEWIGDREMIMDYLEMRYGIDDPLGFLIAIRNFKHVVCDCISH